MTKVRGVALCFIALIIARDTQQEKWVVPAISSTLVDGY